MTRKRLAILLIVLALATAGLVFARTTRPLSVPSAEIPPEVTEKFFSIAAKLSRYPLPLDRPKIVVADAKMFEDDPNCDGRGEKCIVLGYYNFVSPPDTIYINVKTPPDKRASTIVHEIVHWLQDRAGRYPGTCEEQASIELEAYVADYRYSVEYTPYDTEPDLPVFTCHTK